MVSIKGCATCCSGLQPLSNVYLLQTEFPALILVSWKRRNMLCYVMLCYCYDSYRHYNLSYVGCFLQ